MDTCNHYPVLTVGHESPRILWITSDLKNQPINTILDSETLEHFSEWQNTLTASVHGPIVNPPFHIEFTIEQQAHIFHLKMQLHTNESRHVLIRGYLYLFPNL